MDNQRKWIAVLSCLLVLYPVARAQRALGVYNVDRTKITTSGLSSGASMATQMHVAYSSWFSGAGLIAGSPYYCAKGNLMTALNACMSSPNSINVNDLITATNNYAAKGDIDPTSNLRNHKVFILGGTLDTTVVQGCGMKAQQFYLNYVNEGNIKTNFNIAAAHTQPTIDYGNGCGQTISPYIGKCNYNAAFEVLQHLYGGVLQEPTGTVPLNGEFYEFDQKEFFYISPPLMSSMDNSGYVYVPSGCTSGANVCRLHVVYHGCLQGKHKIADRFARNAGYNEVGELNNIIILYPQATSYGTNSNGCWDWWGYTIAGYATKGANQPLATFRMVEKIVGTGGGSLPDPTTTTTTPTEPPACG